MKKFMRILNEAVRNNSGFSLMEVIVAAGMMGIVSLGVVQMTSNMQKSSKTMAYKFSITQLQNRAFMVLSSPFGCANTIAGAIPATATGIVIPNGISDSPPPAGTFRAANIIDQNGNDVLTVGTVYGAGSSGALTYNGFTLFPKNATTLIFELNFARVGAVAIDKVAFMTNFNKRIDITLPLGITGNITGCNATGGANESQLHCETLLGGTYNITTGTCTEIHLGDSTTGATETNAAGVFDGLQVVDWAAPDSDTNGGGLLVGGAIDINVPNSGEAIIETFLQIGTGNDSLLEVGNGAAASGNGNAQIMRSLSVGKQPPTDAAGQLLVSQGVGIGVAPPAGVNGLLYVNNSVGIGTPPSGNAGSLRTSGSSTIGNSSDDQHRFTGSIGLGVGAPGPNDMRIQGSIGIGTAPNSIDGSISTTGRSIFGDSGADTHFFNGSVGIGASPVIGQGNLRTSGRTYLGDSPTDFHVIQGAMNLYDGGSLSLTNGHITTSRTASQIGLYGFNNRRFVTKEWVYNQFAAGFTLAQRQAIVSNILSMTNSNAFNSFEEAIGDQTISSIYVDNCPDNTNYYVAGINLAITAQSNINHLRIQPLCLNKNTLCASGVCVTANHRVRRTAHTGYHFTASGAVISNSPDCTWYGSSFRVSYGANNAIITAQGLKACPGNRPTMSGLRTYPTTGGTGFTVLCCSMRVPTN
jgi:hypothetical protein